jgi:hypothetical protein
MNGLTTQSLTPSPQPSPIKGEGKRVDINVYFWDTSHELYNQDLRFGVDAHGRAPGAGPA